MKLAEHVLDQVPEPPPVSPVNPLSHHPEQVFHDRDRRYYTTGDRHPRLNGTFYSGVLRQEASGCVSKCLIDLLYVTPDPEVGAVDDLDRRHFRDAREPGNVWTAVLSPEQRQVV